MKANNDKRVKSLQIPSEPTPYGLLDQTPFTFVDTEELLIEMAGQLSQSDEIAVDLEHHSDRTYLGVTCLMQISTRSHDYIVDTLALQKRVGHHLRAIFDNPDIVKVLHGSDSDIEWLQRDFSLYVVNMFDTGQAARTLGIRYALSHLYEIYCKVLADKKY